MGDGMSVDLRDALRRAAQLLGVALPVDAGLAVIERALAEMGLQLAIVEADAPAVQLSDARLLTAAMERAVGAGEPIDDMQARLARMLGRNRAAVSRAARSEADLGTDARARLVEHLLDPAAHPLPPSAPGRWGKIDRGATD